MTVPVHEASRFHSVTMSPTQSLPRQTSNLGFGDHLRMGTANTASTLGHAFSVVSPQVPGAAVVSAALNGAASQLAIDPYGGGGVGPSALNASGAVAGGMNPQQNALQNAEGMMSRMRQENMEFLTTQTRVHQQAQWVGLAAALAQARHDAAKEVLRKI